MKRNLMSKILPIPAGLGLALLSFAASADVGMAEQFAAWNQSKGTQVQSEVGETRAQVADRSGSMGALYQSVKGESDSHDIFRFGRPE